MNLKFTQKEFDKLRVFQNRMNKEFGENAYVGTNNACVLVEYSPKLTEMIRPLAQCNQFEYELKQLKCEDCGGNRMYLAAPDENTYVCEDCLTKRQKAKKDKNACVVPQAKADDLQEGFTPQ